MLRNYRHIKEYETECNSLKKQRFTETQNGRYYRTKLKTFDEARLLIDEYVYFYNNKRIQIKTKLTPLDTQCQHVA